MADPTDLEITMAMIAHGGSFVAALGRLFALADNQNRATLKAAFPKLFETYRELVLLKRSA